MNILIAVHGYPPAHTAGAERQAERMARWLAGHGHNVEVLTVETANTPDLRLETAEQDGILVHRLHLDLNLSSENSFSSSYNIPVIHDIMHDLLRARQFDLVHLISGYLLGAQVIFATQELGIPVVVSPMEYWFLCVRLNLIDAGGALCTGPETDQKCARCLIETKRRYRLATEYFPPLADTVWKAAFSAHLAENLVNELARRREMLHQALDSANLVICNSRFLISMFADYGFDTSRFVYVRQGLATAPPHTSGGAHNGDRQAGLRLGYIGQIKFHKGVDLAVRAVETLRHQGYALTLDIWGNEAEDPAYVNRLKRKTEKHAAVRWNGPYAGAQVWDVLQSIDALVVPSRWYENSPNVILEAFSIGLPVIATNLGGMAEMVQHEQSGLLFSLNDASDLTAQIKRLLTEKGLLPRLRSGIPLVKTIDQEMQETVTLYTRLLEVCR